ncbi:ImmA/IrrE family metallo-endopeptidase [Lactococcus allomyrinae]|uniref:ImmA/IrrE family metallo-endopeptidase n=1 Tax=Lactococcus allomyrinae TaxID=2419773 RepID=A0A387BC21_9LACT|nr:ImmA/IrrE family metallo-endopeptidase [Lactococcus allomyrinae]AYG01333.1 ImmA/IrrE family metallo-endopeptidase [Lactococcus allomyrinae]
MNNFEYRVVSSTIYSQCLNKANELLEEIAKYLNKPVSKVAPLDVIAYFEANYNILFTFFETDPHAPIKYNDIVKNYKFSFLDDYIVREMSGVTIPQNGKNVIMINQTKPKSRIIFTILHELSHLYFHGIEANKKIFASKFSGVYPAELMPFEDEANIIASILFCPTLKLETFLTRNYSFNNICISINISKTALRNRLLNYFYHIIGLSYKEALDLVSEFINGNYKSARQIKSLIDKKNFKPTTKFLPVKTSRGVIENQQECIIFLQKLSIEELLFEQDYAYHYKNYTLLQLVMNEYLKKQQSNI